MLTIYKNTTHRIYFHGIDISRLCVLTNGRSNPFGWSTYDIKFFGIIIGWLNCGYPTDLKKGFTDVDTANNSIDSKLEEIKYYNDLAFKFGIAAIICISVNIILLVFKIIMTHIIK